VCVCVMFASWFKKLWTDLDDFLWPEEHRE